MIIASLTHRLTLIGLCALGSIIAVLCSLYAYRVNAERAPDDPEKKEFSLRAIWLVPITWPFLLMVHILTVILSSLALGLFLILFPLALLLIRKPARNKRIWKRVYKIGNNLLEINDAMLRAVGLQQPPAILHMHEAFQSVFFLLG